MLGIVGGTGIYGLGKFSERDVATPYGFAQVWLGKIGSTDCAFIPRHGRDHSIPPHMVNYRANVWALNSLGVEGVLATYAVGIISGYRPGDFVCAEDFIGFCAPITFYDDFKGGSRHMDFSEPFDGGMKARLASAAKEAGIRLKRGGIVATTRGPRFETKAEIKALAAMGANLVSMTNAYEAALFHELEMPAAALCIATNYAAGISKKPLSHSEVVSMMAKKEKEVNAVVNAFAALI